MPGYVVFYDAQCELCRRTRTFLERHRGTEPMRFVDVNDRQAMRAWPQVDVERAQRKVFVMDANGRISQGYEAVLTLLAATVPMVRFVKPLLSLPPINWIGSLGYHLVSNYRYSLSSAFLEHRRGGASPVPRATRRSEESTGFAWNRLLVLVAVVAGLVLFRLVERPRSVPR